MKPRTVFLLALAIAAGVPSGAHAAADPQPATSATAPQALPTAAPDEDLAISARAKAEFLALQAGKIERSHYSKSASDALTDALLAQVAPQLKAAGDIKSMIYQGKILATNKDIIYQYTLVLTNYTAALTFTLTPDDKIDGLNIR
jgi:hypothetical protein